MRGEGKTRKENEGKEEHEKIKTMQEIKVEDIRNRRKTKRTKVE